MTSLHEPMTSTTTSISQPTTPSLHLLRESIESGGKDAANLDLNKVNDKANTSFQTDNSLVSQAASLSDVEDLKIQRQPGDFTDSTTGNFQQFSGSSQNSDASQSTLNLATEQNNQLRVMTVHSNEHGSVSGLNPTSFAMSSKGTTQVTQVQNVLSSTEVDNGQVPATVTVENHPEGTKYTYYPAVQTADASSATAGQFYVMMSPQDMIPTVSCSTPQRIIAPRGHQIASMGDAATFTVETETAIPVEFRKVETGGRSSRDERRRATHNEVERRRRDKINTWIMKLATIIPECQEDQTKQGQSKGGILSKALDYIGKLRSTNERLAETLKDHDRLIVENQVLRQQTEELRRENALLRANLHMQQQHDHSDVSAVVAENQPMDASH